MLTKTWKFYSSRGTNIKNLFTIENWYQKPLGEALLKSEEAGLADVLPKIFGYYIVQAGGPVNNKKGLLSASGIHNRIILNSISPTLLNSSLAVQCNLDELPFVPESIDAIVLFHILEFSKNPKIILQEAYDSIINGGYLIILGFNPRSLWGISRLLRRTKNDIWGGDWISPGRLRHWLVSVGFQVGDYQTFYFRPPHKNSKRMLFMEGMGQICWPYCGASYIFVAHKASTVITPIGGLKHLVSTPQIAERLPKPTST